MNVKKIAAVGLAISSLTSVSSIDVSAAYSASAAITYAKTYVNRGNPEYIYFDANCTNFVSQCIFNGGVSMKNAPKNIQATRLITNDKNAWYYVTDGYNYKITQSWTTVDGFYQYWRDHDNGVCSSDYTVDQVAKVVEPGDVVQVRDKNNKHRHSVLCTKNTNVRGKNDKSKIEFTYNSDDDEKQLDRFHRDFAMTFGLDASTLKYRIIRFK